MLALVFEKGRARVREAPRPRAPARLRARARHRVGNLQHGPGASPRLPRFLRHSRPRVRRAGRGAAGSPGSGKRVVGRDQPLLRALRHMPARPRTSLRKAPRARHPRPSGRARRVPDSSAARICTRCPRRSPTRRRSSPSRSPPRARSSTRSRSTPGRAPPCSAPESSERSARACSRTPGRKSRFSAREPRAAALVRSRRRGHGRALGHAARARARAPPGHDRVEVHLSPAGAIRLGAARRQRSDRRRKPVRPLRARARPPARRKIDVRSLLSAEFPLARAGRALAEAARPGAGKILLRPGA